MMIKALHKQQSISLEIVLDPSFRGILRGTAHDESEGCTIIGQLVMTIHHATKVRRLESYFSGHLEVDFKTTNAIGVPTSDGTERRSFYKKTIVHLENHADYQPGTYHFPISFDVPAAAPQTFSGKHGSITYHVAASLYRTSFNSDIHTSHPITIRRCRMDSINPVAPATQTVKGLMHPEVMTYFATAPSMVYCEGGLIKLNLNVQLKDPKRYKVRVVTCGLQEIVYYRTTGTRSLTNQACHLEEITYPLGYSTFFPSKHPEYNPAKLHHYSAVFRLYPKVNTDNRSSLIVVHHAMFIRMLVDDTMLTSKKNSTVKSIISHLSKSEEAKLMEQNLPEFGPTNIEDSFYSIPQQQVEEEEETILTENHHHNHTNNSYIFNSTSTPQLSPANSELSLSSMSEHSEYQQPSTVTVSPSTRKSILKNLDNGNIEEESDTETASIHSLSQRIGHTLDIRHHLKPSTHLSKMLNDNGVYECHLTIPLIVTSREEYDEGNIPSIPDYEDALIKQSPPTYEATVNKLPPVPVYQNSSNL
ncbi:hypothetical protein K501DRAFT_332545 [Backusella circina FSU 941]|nr:hypothetical protein K501DRAFT_332545 [Backusella circina FSU 941]